MIEEEGEGDDVKAREARRARRTASGAASGDKRTGTFEGEGEDGRDEECVAEGEVDRGAQQHVIQEGVGGGSDLFCPSCRMQRHRKQGWPSQHDLPASLSTEGLHEYAYAAIPRTLAGRGRHIGRGRRANAFGPFARAGGPNRREA